jgi:3-hydroxyisobutyrate dehydrogenase-like beta-hydroxyacid dehydrogenase
MLNIFKIIKQQFNKMATKQELEQQLAEAIAVAQRLGAENKQLRQANEDLQSTNTRLTEEMNRAIERVRYLAGEVKMLELQKQSKNKYSDNSRNY